MLDSTCTSLSQSWPSLSFGAPQSTVETVADPLGRTTSYTFPQGYNGTLSTITRAAGDAMSYGYNSSRQVTSASNGAGTWTYAYSTSGTALTTTVTDPLGHTQVVSTNTSLDVITSKTDGLGRVTSHAYDSYGRETQVTYPDGNGVQYAYDARGDVTQTTVFAIPSDNQGTHVTKATYPATCTSAPATCNKPLTVTDPNGNVTSYTYDQTTGALLTATLPAGANGVQPQTRYSYTSMSASYKNSGGALVAGTPIQLLTGVSTCATGSAPSCVGTADETRLSISYDPNNNLRPVSTTVSAGDGSLVATTGASYDSIGNLLASTDPIGAVTSYVYDAARQLIGMIAPAAGGTGQTTSSANRFTYNPDGRVTLVEQGYVNSASAADWANFTSQIQAAAAYDAVGRKIQATLSGAGGVQSLTQYSYDAANRPACLAVRMNAAGFGSEPGACTLGGQAGDGPDRITQYTYDASNELTQVVSALGTSAQKTEEKLQYEGNGLVSYFWDGNGNLTTNYWDGFGRLGAVQYPSPGSAGSSNPNDYVGLYYDSNNNLTTKRLRDGTVITMAYDSGNHMTTGGDGATYTYDNMGRPRTANHGGRNLSFAYDALGRMTSQTSNLGVLSYAYDAAGNRTRLTWPDGFAIGFNYNANSTLQSFFEGAGSSGYTPMAFYYNRQNQISTTGRSNGVTGGVTYDMVSRPSTATFSFPSSANNTTLSLSYNESGQVKSIANSNGQYDWPAPANFSHTYGLNGLNQIATNGTYTFTYGAKGNLTSDGVNTYSYDVMSRLITGPNGTSFSYDALGRLASSVDSSGTTTSYLYDGDDLVATYGGAGNVTGRYVFGQGTDQPVMWYSGTGVGGRRFLLSNPQGSIIGVSNVSGTLLAANTYDEFGVPGASNLGMFQYTGQLWLASAGLYYYKARIYSPTLGRFLQTDPIGYGDGANWYNYVHGDPVNGTDPSGLDGDPVNGGTLDGGTVTGSLLGGGGYSGSGGTGGGSGTGSYGGAYQWSGRTQQAPTVSEVVVTKRRQPKIPWVPIAIGVGLILADILIPEIALPAEAAEGLGLFRLLSRACFVAGTLVMTNHGLVPIEKIKPGEMVLSRDPVTGATAYKRVLAVKTPSEQDIYQVTVEVTDRRHHIHHHARFQVTAEHPWRETNGRWVVTKDLHRGDKLVREYGVAARVTAVLDQHREAATYNLEVADYHTYFVGRDRVWVHNACTPGQLAQYTRQLAVAGRESLLKSQASLEGRLAEHEAKLAKYLSEGGYTSSVEKEIRNFKGELDAIRRVLGQ